MSISLLKLLRFKQVKQRGGGTESTVPPIRKPEGTIFLKEGKSKEEFSFLIKPVSLNEKTVRNLTVLTGQFV
ncbi:hypothetical protein [Flavonifractor plautii]|uniref:hypothetical protein n=1 Tax=Flavonifractor plautii TaxID=292800 RepID=UPI00195C7822|nr:hypothetical protein [Flavonifractor plautii]MBM6664196.1 hypothetical protein [Flavonifractor plautii]